MSSHRILQVITRSDWGGAARVVESLSTHIDDVAAVACGSGGRLIDRLDAKNIPVHEQPHLQSPPHPTDLLAYRDLRSLIKEGDYDLVHSHSTKAGALARIAASREGIPSAFTVHGWGFYNTEYRALRPIVIRGEGYLAKRTDEIVCVSENDCREGRTNGILGEEDGTVIHNGIQPIDPPPSRNTLRDEFDIDLDTPIIGAIARLAPQKNPLEILRTAKRLQGRGLDVATVLIGTGALADRCHEFVAENNMDNVFLPGFRDDALELLPDFDVFLLPSRFEGFPLTVLECLHAGVPIVAYDVGGVAEAIDNGGTGFVVPSEDSDGAFLKRVEDVLESPKRREAMSQKAMQKATEHFTEERMVAEYESVYDSILQ